MDIQEIIRFLGYSVLLDGGTFKEMVIIDKTYWYVYITNIISLIILLYFTIYNWTRTMYVDRHYDEETYTTIEHTFANIGLNILFIGIGFIAYTFSIGIALIYLAILFVSIIVFIRKFKKYTSIFKKFFKKKKKPLTNIEKYKQSLK